MLANLVGNVDFNSALVLAIGFICTCIIITSLIVKRRSKLDISNEFQLAKIKLHDEKESKLYALETDRAYKFKQIEQNVITSHKVD